jgi:predicted deacetylase
MTLDNIDEILEQIEIHNKSYEWIVREAEQIANEIKRLDLLEDFDSQGYEIAVKKFMEIEQRFKRNKKDYDMIVNRVRVYFNDKHGIDIIGILNDDENAK